MAQPSKAGVIFLTLFALPFLGGGLFFLYGLLVSRQNSTNGNASVGVAIALFFVFVGGGLIFASFKGYGFQAWQWVLTPPFTYLMARHSYRKVRYFAS